ncbi:unnamed protein product [Musa acuminata subsp. malaccensis]|uniref:(wild Malaysian banana) hypothetical protein n=1 Tax=Musa acuminata subsp. malaccensis TaxID=214687 RepID=A0A8D7F1D3_MUSAM|nr:unnamed protein product [Musa acuminata subsp. malaccensis]
MRSEGEQEKESRKITIRIKLHEFASWEGEGGRRRRDRGVRGRILWEAETPATSSSLSSAFSGPAGRRGRAPPTLVSRTLRDQHPPPSSPAVEAEAIRLRRPPRTPWKQRTEEAKATRRRTERAAYGVR